MEEMQIKITNKDLYEKQLEILNCLEFFWCFLQTVIDVKKIDSKLKIKCVIIWTKEQWRYYLRCIMTVGKNAKAIQEYVANQLKTDKETDQLSIFDPRDPLTGSK